VEFHGVTEFQPTGFVRIRARLLIVEVKKRLRKLRQIARGLRLSLAKMDLSDSERLVVTKILRSANAQIQGYKAQLSESRNAKIPTAEVSPKVLQTATWVPKTVNTQLVSHTGKRERPHSHTTSFPEDSELGEWKKPWNEVSGGSYGQGKSRKH